MLKKQQNCLQNATETRKQINRQQITHRENLQALFKTKRRKTKRGKDNVTDT